VEVRQAQDDLTTTTFSLEAPEVLEALGAPEVLEAAVRFVRESSFS